MKINKAVRRCLRIQSFFSLALLGVPLSASAQEPPPKEATFEVYGFAMADYIQDFKRVNPAWDDTLRPSRIPTEEGTFGSDGQAMISAKQSRLGVQGSAPVADADLKTKFEFDMFGVGVDEGQTTIRLRHAYGEWGQLLAGQTHSLFMDIDVFPNTIDYWGPTGMVFYRLPQIRWTPIKSDSLSVAVAIERPGNDIDAGQIRILDPDLGASIISDEKIPDGTAQVRTQGDWGHVLLGGIVRRVGFEIPNTTATQKGSEVGWGLNLGSSFKLWKRDKLILSAVYGQGIASYMNDGGMDLAPEGVPGSLEAKAVPLLGLTAYYDLYWSKVLSTSLGYSLTQVDNTSFQADDAYHRGEYASINLLYTPGPSILMGSEFLWGQRTDNDGDTGDDVRIQFSVKYSFSSTL